MSNSRGILAGFLPLNPVTSNSYPKVPEVKPAAAHKTRASSISSASSSGESLSPTSPTEFRFLKVAPVHFGEHSGAHQGDWHDVKAADPVPRAALGFLSLGPVTSNSYPKTQQARPAVEGASAPAQRRTSSISSDGKSGFRVLKVAPVHYGEHGGDHQEDWHNVPAVE